MMKSKTNWTQLIMEWVFLAMICLLIWAGILVETPLFKAILFTGVIAISIGLNGIMRKDN